MTKTVASGALVTVNPGLSSSRKQKFLLIDFNRLNHDIGRNWKYSVVYVSSLVFTPLTNALFLRGRLASPTPPHLLKTIGIHFGH